MFHSALGLRPAVGMFADRLRAGGHVVHTPDIVDGATYDNLVDGARKRDAIGIQELMRRAAAAAAALPPDIVVAGFSMGAGAAEFLAATRPGTLAAVLMHGAFAPAAFGIETWPPVPVQVHYAIGDPGVDAGQVEALETAVRATGASIEVFAYDRGSHLFEDAEFEGHDAESAQLMCDRVLAFLDEL
jgi:dienelactone hydrolase